MNLPTAIQVDPVPSALFGCLSMVTAIPDPTCHIKVPMAHKALGSGERAVTICNK